MTSDLVPLAHAVAATAAWLSGVMFFRFWRTSRDRLFALFGTAFWLLSLSWALLSVFSPTEESRAYVYGIRLFGFLLIILAIIQKNREP